MAPIYGKYRIRSQTFKKQLAGYTISIGRMEIDPIHAKHPKAEEGPPFLGTWPRVYTFVLVYLFLLIAILAVATRVLSRN